MGNADDAWDLIENIAIKLQEERIKSARAHLRDVQGIVRVLPFGDLSPAGRDDVRAQVDLFLSAVKAAGYTVQASSKTAVDLLRHHAEAQEAHQNDLMGLIRHQQGVIIDQGKFVHELMATDLRARLTEGLHVEVVATWLLGCFERATIRSVALHDGPDLSDLGLQKAIEEWDDFDISSDTYEDVASRMAKEIVQSAYKRTASVGPKRTTKHFRVQAYRSDETRPFSEYLFSLIERTV